MTGDPWTSLELAKLFASLLVPISIAVVGFLIQKTLRQQEREWAVSETLIKKRLEKFETLADDLNSIYVFIEDIGHWKEETPKSITDKKRQIDRAIYAQRPLWSDATIKAYQTYMYSAFQTHNSTGEDAKVRTADTEKKVGIANWTEGDSNRLTGERNDDHRENYFRLLEAFSQEFQVHRD